VRQPFGDFVWSACCAALVFSIRVELHELPDTEFVHFDHRSSNSFGYSGLLFRRDAPARFTPSALAFCRVALYVRLSLRAITLVFVFSRVMVFSVWTSSLVHGLDFIVFAITRSFVSGSHKAALTLLFFASAGR